jgi:NAD(P)-dependent dehydrogenase (short-subunit alcohol dehydrogenase family)
MARSATRPPFGLPRVRVAVGTSRLSSREEGKAIIFTPVRESSGEIPAKILPQIPLGRLGGPEEIAGLIIYLCSDEAAFVTGANIAINGGQHMQ